MVLPLKKAATSSCCAAAGAAASRIASASAARPGSAARAATTARGLCAGAASIAVQLSKTLLDRATNDRVTFAHDFFQLFAIQYLDHGSAIVDRARIAQRSRHGRHARSAHAQHLGQRFVAELDLVIA